MYQSFSGMYHESIECTNSLGIMIYARWQLKKIYINTAWEQLPLKDIHRHHHHQGQQQQQKIHENMFPIKIS